MKSIRTAVKKVCEVVSDRQGEGIIVLDVSKISSFTDFLIICRGRNQRQNQAICNAVREILKTEKKLTPHHVEGYRNAEWILLDYLDFVIHIFSPSAHQFYGMEKLWDDGIKIAPKTLTD